MPSKEFALDRRDAGLRVAFGALGNALATRGRHFGWLALSAVVALAVAGY